MNKETSAEVVVQEPTKNLDPYELTKNYLSEKEVYDIFKSLTIDLILKKPTDPIQFMINHLRHLKENSKIKQ